MEVLVLLFAVLFFGWLLKGLSRRPPRRRRNLRPLFWEPRTEVVYGKAYVTDGDGIRVSGYNIRLTGLDAPEWGQVAKHQHGYWFNHGKSVKRALIQAIGGKYVQVAVEGCDKYGRVLGSVTCDRKDVGAWLVRNGYAISAYGDKYKDIEREAKLARRGLWGHAETYDPRAWRHKGGGEMTKKKGIIYGFNKGQDQALARFRAGEFGLR